jgi:carbon-monoxide dehydrogenase small subunit
MMMTARALLDRNPDPTEQEIREAISGQICRCTGYATSSARSAGRPSTRPDPLPGNKAGSGSA